MRFRKQEKNWKDKIRPKQCLFIKTMLCPTELSAWDILMQGCHLIEYSTVLVLPGIK